MPNYNILDKVVGKEKDLNKHQGNLSQNKTLLSTNKHKAIVNLNKITDDNKSLKSNQEESKSGERKIDSENISEIKIAQSNTFAVEDANNENINQISNAEKTSLKYYEIIDLFNTTFKAFSENIIEGNIKYSFKEGIMILEKNIKNPEIKNNRLMELTEKVDDKDYFQLLNSEVRENILAYKSTCFSSKLVNVVLEQKNIEYLDKTKNAKKILLKHKVLRMPKTEWKDSSYLFQFMTNEELEILLQSLKEWERIIKSYEDFSMYIKDRISKWIQR